MNPNGINLTYGYEKEFFIDNIIKLDSILKNSEKEVVELIEKKNTEKVREKRLKLQREKDEKIRDNKESIQNSIDYKYYRKCLINKHIKQAISKTMNKIDYVQYNQLENKYEGNNRKFHIYRLFEHIDSDPLIELQYIIIGKYNSNNYEFHQSIINVIKRSEENDIGIKRMILEQKAKSPIKLKSIRSEIVKDYLHSYDSFALINYDDEEKISKEHYYLYNQKVDKETHSEISDYYETSGLIQLHSESAKKIIKRINKNYENKLDFTRYLNQDIPIELFESHYRDIYEPIPLVDDLYKL